MAQYNATWPGGDSYTGSKLDGMPHGRGAFTWANGDRYSGDWHKGIEHGHGTQTVSNSQGSIDRYDGQWKTGKRHGIGKYKWGHTGQLYIGQWIDGKCEGSGQCTLPNGGRYCGDYKKGVPTGVGYLDVRSPPMADGQSVDIVPAVNTDGTVQFTFGSPALDGRVGHREYFG